MTTRQIAYREYLTSDHWHNLRQQIISRDGNKCVHCPHTKRLQAHHTIYRDRFEDSLPEDLITLCNPCHRKAHGIEIPKKSQRKKIRLQKPSAKKLKARARRKRLDGIKTSRNEMYRDVCRWKNEIRRRNWSF